MSIYINLLLIEIYFYKKEEATLWTNLMKNTFND